MIILDVIIWDRVVLIIIEFFIIKVLYDFSKYNRFSN